MELRENIYAGIPQIDQEAMNAVFRARLLIEADQEAGKFAIRASLLETSKTEYGCVTCSIRAFALVTYTPFGETRENLVKDTNGNWVSPTSSSNEFTQYKFTGQEYDPETGFYNYNARLYDPMIGRFLSPDSIIPDTFNSQAFNRYSYCVNNPILYTDPTGHWFGIDDLIAAAIGAVVGYVSYGLSTGKWLSWGALAAAGIGAATSWVLYNLAGMAAGALNKIGFNVVANAEVMGVPVSQIVSYLGAATGAWGSSKLIPDSEPKPEPKSESPPRENLYASAGVSDVDLTTPIGVYRDPDIVGFYSDDPLIYSKTEYHYFYGMSQGMFQKGKGIAGTFMSGQWKAGSIRINIYGSSPTTPTSWEVAKWDVIGKEYHSGWDMYGWRVLSYQAALNTNVAQTAFRFFNPQPIIRSP